MGGVDVWVGGVLRSLCHASAGLHLLQSFREVAVVRLQFVHLVQRRPQLSGQTEKENYLGHEGRQKYRCWHMITASRLPPDGGLRDKSSLHCQKDLHQIECFPSLLDSFHTPIRERTNEKHLESGWLKTIQIKAFQDVWVWGYRPKIPAIRLIFMC